MEEFFSPPLKDGQLPQKAGAYGRRQRSRDAQLANTNFIVFAFLQAALGPLLN